MGLDMTLSPATMSKSGFFPENSFSQRGILYLPISSQLVWCVQLSRIKILSPSFIVPILGVPFKYSSKGPFSLDKVMLKDVRGMSRGIILSALSNIWLSVTARAGFILCEARKCSTAFSFNVMAMASLSRTSLIACTCGSIMRPAGASVSIGVIRRTMSFFFTIPLNMDGAVYADSGMCEVMVLTSSSNPFPFIALISVNARFLYLKEEASSEEGGVASTMLKTMMKGISLRLNSFISISSCSPNWLCAITSSARSTIFIDSRVLLTLFNPSSPLSSTPAVSTRITGPKFSISTDFFTGSVVVPAWLDTMATSCPARRLIRVLLPLFLRP